MWGWRKIKPLKATLKSRAFLLFAFISLVPHLLFMAGAEFAGLASVYLGFPAGMGVFALAQLYLVFNFFGWTSPFAYVSALLFALLWTRLLQWVESLDKFAVVIFYMASFFLMVWVLLAKIMPPA